MTTEKGHPSRDELLVMAYVDDELSAEVRDELEQRLVSDRALALQVAEYKRLELAARACAPPEPADHEWARLRDDDVRRAWLALGWILLFGGSVGFIGWLALLIRQSDLGFTGKCSLSLLLAGFTILLLIKLRDRMRLLPYDPYTEVKR